MNNKNTSHFEKEVYETPSIRIINMGSSTDIITASSEDPYETPIIS